MDLPGGDAVDEEPLLGGVALATGGWESGINLFDGRAIQKTA